MPSRPCPGWPHRFAGPFVSLPAAAQLPHQLESKAALATQAKEQRCTAQASQSSHLFATSKPVFHLRRRSAGTATARPAPATAPQMGTSLPTNECWHGQKACWTHRAFLWPPLVTTTGLPQGTWAKSARSPHSTLPEVTASKATFTHRNSGSRKRSQWQARRCRSAAHACTARGSLLAGSSMQHCAKQAPCWPHSSSRPEGAKGTCHLTQ